MNILLETKSGFTLEAGGQSNMRLLEYPDLGCPQAIFQSDKIPQMDGELFRSTRLGTRDIILKAEAGVPLYIISRTLTPGTEVTALIDGRWKICGRISGIKEFRRPARMAKPVISIGIRCFDPFFTKINALKTVSFSNAGGGIYQNGSYTCQRLLLYNEGDVPCPVSVTMSSSAGSASTPSGLFNYLDWNNGKPVYTGLIFKKGTDTKTSYFITTDTFSDRFFESYSVLDACDYFLLPPGESVLYAQNVSGTLSFDPKFLYVDGREL